MTAAPALIGGPYAAPDAAPGDTLYCEYAYEDVVVGGLTDAAIPWPRRRKSGKPSLILTGDLIRAVQIESELAIAQHWGVGVVTVWKWRKALGIGRITEGTAQLYRDVMPAKLPPEAQARGRARAAKPAAIERMAATKRGVPAHPNTRAALINAAAGPRYLAWREAIGLSNRRRAGRKDIPVTMSNLAASMVRLLPIVGDMTLNQIAVLTHCVSEAPHAQTYLSLGRIIPLDTERITYVVTQLAERGLLARRGASDDARISVVRPTRKGIRLAQEIAGSILVRVK